MLRIKFHRSWVLFVTLFAFQLSSSAPTIAQQAAAWAGDRACAMGARVTYQGVLYQCRQAHTSLVTWEPPNTPALWLVVTGGGGGGDTQAPSAPPNLRVTGLTASSVSLAWNASSDNVGVSRYDVLRHSAEIVGAATAGFTATGLASTTSFTFPVGASEAAGNVPAVSNQVTVKTQPVADTQAPTTPANLRVTIVTSTGHALVGRVHG